MALLTDDTVDGLDINVDTFDGQVTLHGQVDSSAEKSEAESRSHARSAAFPTCATSSRSCPTRRARTSRISDEALTKPGARPCWSATGAAEQRHQGEVGEQRHGRARGRGQDAQRPSARPRRRARGRRRAPGGQRDPQPERARRRGDLGRASTSAVMTATATSNAAYDAWITTKVKVRLMAEPGTVAARDQRGYAPGHRDAVRDGREHQTLKSRAAVRSPQDRRRQGRGERSAGRPRRRGQARRGRRTIRYRAAVRKATRGAGRARGLRHRRGREERRGAPHRYGRRRSTTGSRRSPSRAARRVSVR